MLLACKIAQAFSIHFNDFNVIIYIYISISIHMSMIAVNISRYASVNVYHLWYIYVTISHNNWDTSHGFTWMTSLWPWALVSSSAAWQLLDRNCWPDFSAHYAMCCQEAKKELAFLFHRRFRNVLKYLKSNCHP